MKFLGLKISTYRGITVVDFNIKLSSIYEELGGVPHVLFNNNGYSDERIYNGLKIELTKGITPSEKINLAQSYKVSHVREIVQSGDIGYRDKHDERQLTKADWDAIDKYKYCFIQPAIHMELLRKYDEADSQRDITQYEIIKRTHDRLLCIIVNIKELSKMDKENLVILTDKGEMQIDNLYTELIALDGGHIIYTRNVAMTDDLLEGVTLITDNDCLYIMDSSYKKDGYSLDTIASIENISNKEIYTIGYNLSYMQLSKIAGNPLKVSEISLGYDTDNGLWGIIHRFQSIYSVLWDLFGLYSFEDNSGQYDLCRIYTEKLPDRLELDSVTKEYMNNTDLLPKEIPNNYIEKGEYEPIGMNLMTSTSSSTPFDDEIEGDFDPGYTSDEFEKIEEEWEEKKRKKEEERGSILQQR